MSGRIRSIKPEWLDDELLALASSDARTLSISLLLLADDYGNGRASLVLLAGRVFPGKPVSVLTDAIKELAEIRFVRLYECDGQKYFSIRNWTKHQRVDKPGKPHVPGPPPDAEVKPLGGSRESLAKVPGSLAPDRDQDQRPGPGEDQENTPARARDFSGVDLPLVAHDAQAENETVPPLGANAAEPELEPGEPEHDGPRIPVAQGFAQQVEDALRKSYPGKMPELYGKCLTAAAKHVRGLSEHYGKRPSEIIPELCAAADPTREDWVFRVATVDPYKPSPPSRASPGRGRLTPSRGTKEADWEGEEDTTERNMRLLSGGTRT